ncbi:M48 family metallopeptidase [Lewinella sp. W8]|uniref:tetratricopeptide repeat protein n=1 Tax=Lewinella sp. W8 TaxID=2528208 RepID=UPI001067DAF2|nr:hypothetical protein [Lewinella sp. W8]MTB52580.1 hypothetical protein [Lewinella sp. W8]
MKKTISKENQAFFRLGMKLGLVYHKGNHQDGRARHLAEEYLIMARKHPDSWNYGNAIHCANTVLGLLALENGRTDEAVVYLHRAGATPGSPQLNSFGPNMLLAKELIEAGRVESVLAYLEQCRKFWRGPMVEKIAEWHLALLNGEELDYAGHLKYHLNGFRMPISEVVKAFWKITKANGIFSWN